MELPKRKNPRLKGYDYSSNGAYFITICVKDRRHWLGKIAAPTDAAAVRGDAHITPPPPIPPQISTSSIVKLSEYGLLVQKHMDNINAVYFDVSLDKYVIMPNHLHLILYVNGIIGELENGMMRASSPTTPAHAIIPDIIRTLKTMVTKQIGFSIWQRSYYDHIIRNEADYLRIWHYIDNNPIKWAEDRFYY